MYLLYHILKIITTVKEFNKKRMKKDNQYYTNRHSCFLLQYHLVLVTKYRKKVFNKDMEEYLLRFVSSMMEKNDCNLMVINYHGDHVHILFEAPVMLNLPNFINGLKSTSSRMIRRRFSEYLKQFFETPVFWSRSYFICTVSEHTTQVVQEYIRKQGD